MSYEWHVKFALDLRPWRSMEARIRTQLEQRGKKPTRSKIEERGKQELHPVVKGSETFVPVGDLYSRFSLLSQTVGEKEGDDKQNTWNTLAKSVYLEEVIQRRQYDAYIKTMNSYLHDLGLLTPALTEADLACLPRFSFFLYVPFTLAAPYLSKDDEPFYVHENPVRKEHVLRVPLMASTSWKGTFRAALRYHLQGDDNDPRIVRLLGNSKGAEEGFRRGRLSFFPTFFDALEVEVINPHSRETSAGSQPIHIEAVPPGAHGVFALLYVPAIAPPADAGSDRSTVLDDVLITLRTTYTLLVELGFGAKSASGMGRAKLTIPRMARERGYFLLPLGKGDAPLHLPIESLRDLLGVSQYIEEQRGGGHEG